MIKNCLVPNKNNSYKAYLLRKTAIVIYSVILLLVNTFGSVLGIEQAQASTITPENIIALTNAERVNLGLSTLSYNAQLSSAALAKANDMFEKQYWDHFGPNGETPWQFIRGAGYSYIYAGENLAKGFKTSESVVEAWMASPTHKANIVNSNYRDIGVAVVEGILQGKQTILVVQMFGTLPGQVESATITNSQIPTVTKTETVTNTPVVTKEIETKNNSEQQIKSISIITPANGETYNDPKITVSGNVENVNEKYGVEVIENNEVVADTTSEISYWNASKASDWSEGSHTITANIKGTDVSSSPVSFNIDSSAPQIDVNSLKVREEDDFYVLSFTISENPQSVEIVSGSKIIPADVTDGGRVEMKLSKGDIGDSVVIRISDKYQNDSELDISEYFSNENSQKRTLAPIVSLTVGNLISIGIIGLVFALLCIEIYEYMKRGMLKDAVGDVLTVGIWWAILAVAIFSGFSGNIN
ncbi:MAG TPA: CAP domain-containing protein [Candidatus Dojkabacteria bacterium]|nr:CAP domain-containing protein [Candidatus Dojkabacteria bacterium]